MKFFIVLTAIVTVASAIPLHGGLVNTGSSAVSRSEDGYGNYAFGYNEDHATGGTFRKEKGGPGVQVGSYGIRDADGRVRTVNYVADALGFRASISSNEPGVDPHQVPAATTLNGNAPVVPALHYAPAVVPVAHAVAPLAHGPVLAYGHGPAASYSVNTHHASVHAAPLLAHGHGPVLAHGGAYGHGLY